MWPPTIPALPCPDCPRPPQKCPLGRTCRRGCALEVCAACGAEPTIQIIGGRALCASCAVRELEE